MSRYLITGGAGFIGSHLANMLASQDNEIYIIDDLSTGNISNLSKTGNIHFIKGNILDSSLLEQIFQNIDYIFHLAAVASVQQSINDWYYSHQVNLSATIEIFLKAAELGIPVVYASSAAVYGACQNLPLRESEVVTQLSPYGLDKYNCELQAKLLGQLKDLKSIGLRFFNVYGAGQSENSDYSGVISIFKKLIKQQKRLSIFGDGEQFRDFIHVSDVVRALILAEDVAGVEAPVVNICTGKSYTLNQIINIISETKNIVGVDYKDSKSGNIKFSVGSPDLAEKILGFKAQQDFKEQLMKL